MRTLIFNFQIPINPIINPTGMHKHADIKSGSFNFKFQKIGVKFSRITRKVACPNSQRNDGEDEQSSVQELKVPSHWLDPSKASEQESEWLRVTLHKWLDDEYCPEPTNIEISKIAAISFYKTLVEKKADLGEILLKMASDLESISYQESFHGPFSSANAAVNLIVQRISEG